MFQGEIVERDTGGSSRKGRVMDESFFFLKVDEGRASAPTGLEGQHSTGPLVSVAP